MCPSRDETSTRSHPQPAPANRHKRASGACRLRASALIEAVVGARHRCWSQGGDEPPPTAEIARCSFRPNAAGRFRGPAHPRTRATIAFLKTIDREVPKGSQVHLILDNYATHNHPNVKRWLAKHPRFELHFTPTSSSWLNMVEIFFGQLTNKAIRRGIFHSVPNLIDAIETYLAAHNENPQPFVWTATTDKILEKVRRGRVTLDAITS